MVPTRSLNPSTRRKTNVSKPEKLRVVLVEPGQYAREAEIDNTLEAKQAVVGGVIDAIYPWKDDAVALIINDAGKVIPLEPNRALPEYEDIVFGAFFICGDDGENFCSLTDRQVQRYLERFRQPEIIFDSPVGIVAMPCGPDQYARFMQAARGDGGGEPPARRNRPTR